MGALSGDELERAAEIPKCGESSEGELGEVSVEGFFLHPAVESSGEVRVDVLYGVILEPFFALFVCVGVKSDESAV